MGNTRRWFFAFGVVLLGPLAAACGASGAVNTPTSGADRPVPQTAKAVKATVRVESSELGSILVDASGRTLYAFAKDTGSTSTCTDTCAAAWPALTVDGGGAPTGDGIDASKFGTTKRDDGSEQVVFGGHPLYRFSGDTEPGDTNGQGLNDVWFVVSPDGAPVRSAEPTSAY